MLAAAVAQVIRLPLLLRALAVRAAVGRVAQLPGQPEPLTQAVAAVEE
jgi:hypothetical protein